MAPPMDSATEQAAWSKQYDAQQTEQASQEEQAKQPPSPQQRFTVPQGRVTPSMLDSFVNEAQLWGTAAKRVGQDVAAGAITGATNMADAAGSFMSASGHGLSMAEDPEHADDAGAPLPTSPIWDHAKGAIMDFRDAVAVKDPNMVDTLTQGVAQLAVPFAGYSRMLSGLHGIANIVAAGGLTDATALAPHDMRMADVLRQARMTEGKLGEVLRTLAPDGSALNAYINYLAADRSQESEAGGRLKNVIDGFGVNMIATPLIHAVATTLKQGTAGLRYLMDNGVTSSSEMVGPAAQRGAVGDLSQRAPLKQNYDPAEQLLEEQVRKDADAAAANPGGKRPPLIQGSDPAGPMFDAQARADAEAAAKAHGKVVYHGTSYDFDAFDASKIGSGEGNQTFGHGLYFAEKPETAGHYQQMAIQRTGAVGAALAEAQNTVKKAGGRAQAYTQLSQALANEKDPIVRQQLQQQMNLIRSGNYARGQGTLVHAQIANEHLDSMMHWDKPIEEQPALQKVISNLDVKVVPEGNKFRVTVNGKPGQLYMDRNAALSDTDILRGEGTTGAVNAGMFYDQLAGALRSQKAASDFLGRRGVTGIKYLDQGSRDAGEGTHNFVLFNAKHAQIVKKEKAGA